MADNEETTTTTASTEAAPVTAPIQGTPDSVGQRPAAGPARASRDTSAPVSGEDIQAIFQNVAKNMVQDVTSQLPQLVAAEIEKRDKAQEQVQAQQQLETKASDSEKLRVLGAALLRGRSIEDELKNVKEVDGVLVYEPGKPENKSTAAAGQIPDQNTAEPGKSVTGAKVDEHGNPVSWDDINHVSDIKDAGKFWDRLGDEAQKERKERTAAFVGIR